MLLLITARFKISPPNYPHLTNLAHTPWPTLAALRWSSGGGGQNTAEVMDQILAHRWVPQVHRGTTKMVLEGGVAGTGWPVCPRTSAAAFGVPPLQASLLDALIGYHWSEVAQIGAVAGRDFHYELLNAVAGLPRGDGTGATSWCGRWFSAGAGAYPSTRWYGTQHIPAS
jgi:hypothetical protein